MTTAKTVIYIYVLLILIVGCGKWDDYSTLVPPQIVYPGVISNLAARPGNGRVELLWTPSTDARITRYVVYWNNNADSVAVNANTNQSTDTVRVLISGLGEYAYTFRIFSYDAKGNSSVPVEFSSVRSFGPTYRSALLNRALNQVSYDNGRLLINWKTPDTVNVRTLILYKKSNGDTGRLDLSPDSSQISIADWSLGTTLYYRSSYKPVKNALDSFTVSFYDSIRVSNVPINKSTWKQVMLPFDITGDAYGTNLANIWDGKVSGINNGNGIYHSGPSDPMPQHFTIDLGKLYTKLTQFEEWGRQDCSCHNVAEMEVWGIADTTGAATTVPSTDAAWKQNSTSKGWTLLTTVKRTDDGIAGIKSDLITAIPPVRFVRIRVLKTVDAHPHESHMSEISFRYNP